MGCRVLDSSEMGIEERVERERQFHDQYSEEGLEDRRLVGRMTDTFYDKEEGGVLWFPIWKRVNLAGKTVLDYGCGSGGFTYELAKRGAILHGIDISQSLISLAENMRYPKDVPPPKLSVQDAHQTQFPDGFFDYVFGNGILHHLEIERAYAEVARVLKPKGQAFFAEPLIHHPLVRLVRWLTPKARSADEKPLTFETIGLASQLFRVQHSEHFLFSVAAAPLHLFSDKVAKSTIHWLEGIDQFWFRSVPSSRRYAWITLIELEKL